MTWISLALALCFPAVSRAQTTQGLISGRIVNVRSGAPVGGGQVAYYNTGTGTSGVASGDASGNYYLPLLSPGLYRIRVTAEDYQAQEVHELELPVAGRLELNFRMRPLNDVWEAGQYRSVFLPGTKSIVTFYGPDVDSSRSASFESAKARRGVLESTISQVIDPAQVKELPLAGRDVYTMLVTQPGVTADGGTARGLGLAINGQRPSASNFLLDGLENNNYLVTGPLTSIAPEAIQEYRVSTNNFSAEYGRTSGFVANAVSRAGGNDFHGIGYWYLKNDALNANGFQENRLGNPRLPAKERQLGFQVGGPILRERLFFSSAYEHLRSRSRQEPFTVTLPSTRYLSFLQPNVTRRLLEQHPAPPVTDGNLLTANLTVAPPVSVDRALALERVDYISPSGKHRLMARAMLSDVGRPDFIWTPYEGFNSRLDNETLGLGFTYMYSIRPGLLNEIRLGRNRDDVRWNRPHPEVPTLVSGDGVVLPGSPAFYEYQNRSRNWEILDNVTWARGRHVATFGAGALIRKADGFLTAGRDGQYIFDNIVTLALDRPRFLRVTLSRTALPNLRIPDYDREYGYNQFFWFAQDTFKATPRLALNYGVRYERFGAPVNTGSVKEAVVELGQGSDFPSRLAGARLAVPGGGENQKLYGEDTNDWAVRAGFSYDLFGSARTLLRGSFGIFYDRPFDNLWQNLRSNDGFLPFLSPVSPSTDYLAPVASHLSNYSGAGLTQDFPKLTMLDQNLRSGYSQSYFFGVQQQVSDNWAVEVNTLGSLARKLLVTDIVNRQFTLPQSPESPEGRFNPGLPDISYRASQGRSNYNALTGVARYRQGRRFFQASYTWSHTIDTQSEPLAGDFFDLSFTRVTSGDGRGGRAAFSRQFDSGIDRANSDFDQRHNLVFLSVWELPRLLSSSKLGWLTRDWRLSQLAAFRSGSPYTVFAPSTAFFGGGQIYNSRANVVDPSRAVLANSQTVAGGKRLLDADAFTAPAASTVGSGGRNAFRGPGLYNIDLSLARSFPLPWLGESGRLTLRADAFNVLNHANLNNPDSLLGSETFGVAQYGRQGRQSGFPAVAPLNETARQIQMILRVEF
ncbi:MAG: carboxypeptidase regulatory-like domain-containing protein [Bryobacteraceae bacterium]